MLAPRSGSFSIVTWLDLWLMLRIIAGRRPNLCIVIINQMIESFSGNKRLVPYGMALSDLLEREVGGLEEARKVNLNLA